MYLKRIELKGFKSFPEKTEIVFNKGITSIVGPNGSGKSNISDAVRWVLGEQSIKSLRGDKLEDVIFAGSEKKKAMNYCEVALTVDNSDSKINIEFTEVTIKRRAYRNGESEFFLNGKSCRLRDIRELFLDTGIGKDSYSIIEQGKVDEILSNNPDARRRVFDEACGISKFRYRRAEAERNLKHTSENLDRINDIFIEIEKQIEPLKIQKEKAEKYAEISERVKKLEVNSFLREIIKLENDAKEVEVLLNETSKIIEEVEAEIEKAEKESVRLNEDVEMADIEISKDAEYISSLREMIGQKDSEINLLFEKSKNIEANIERNKSDIEKYNQNIEKNKNDIKELEMNRIQKNEALDKIEENIKSKEIKNDGSKENIDFMEKRIEEIKDETISLMNKNREFSNKMSVLEANKENMNLRWRNIDTETEELTKEKNKSDSIIKAANNEINLIAKNISSLIDDIKEIKSKTLDCESENKRINSEIIDKKYEINEYASKKKAYVDMENQYEGFKRGVKEVLKNKSLKGIDGAVVQVVRVSEKYEKAIESSLGSAMQNIITEDENAAKKAIEYLKKTERGIVTFLPLNVVKSSLIDLKRIKSAIKPLGIASDMLDYDEKYRNVIESILGKTLIIENIDDAIQFAKDTNYKFKLVTLDGEIFKPGGSMTGGVVKGSGNILSRKRYIEEYTDKIKEISLSIEESEKSLSDNEINETKLKNKLSDKENTLKEEEKNLILKKSELSKSEDDYKRANDGIEKLERERESIGSNIEYTISKVNDINLSIKETGESIEALNKENKELSQKLYDNRKEYDSYRKESEELNLEFVKLTKEIEAIDSDINRMKYENKNISEDIEKITKQIDRDKESIENIEKISDEEKDEKGKIMVTLSKASKKADDRKENREDLKLKYENTNLEIKKKERVRGEKREEYFKISSRLDRMKSGKDGYLNRLFEQYEMTFVQASDIRDDSLEITKKEIETLKRNIKALGNVNMDSIEEYKVTKERYDLYSEQKQDMEESMGRIRSLITELEENMKSEFRKKFGEISKNFKEVYKKLFGGGKGELSIENPDDILESDIVITAQPPGKKMKNINLLSGGEKALTAISILFAIIISRPTPFCILDEIEAPLDDVNVYRFGEFLKELSGDTQFIAVTHRRGTMEASEYIYGVTMQERAVSKVISVKLNEAEKFAEIK